MVDRVLSYCQEDKEPLTKRSPPWALRCVFVPHPWQSYLLCALMNRFIFVLDYCHISLCLVLITSYKINRRMPWSESQKVHFKLCEVKSVLRRDFLFYFSSVFCFLLSQLSSLKALVCCPGDHNLKLTFMWQINYS